jgi:selenide,water dikinase
MTDITGFGFLGHASEVANASDVTLHVSFDAIPLMDGARLYAEQWVFPNGSSNNKKAFEGLVEFGADIQDFERMLLFDAQTSGGLLIALPEAQVEAFGGEMGQRGAAWWRIGQVREPEALRIRVTR